MNNRDPKQRSGKYKGKDLKGKFRTTNIIIE